MSRIHFTSTQRIIQSERMDPWENTKISPTLEVAVSHRQGRYGIEIIIESSFGDGTCSWVMIVNGINKYVTEMTEETQDTSITLENCNKFPCTKQDRKKHQHRRFLLQRLRCHIICGCVWIDVETGPYDKSCFEVSKKMIRLLRHDPSVLREEDGAVEFRILAQMFCSE